MDIYEELVQLRREGRKCALATIVSVNGSIPSFQNAKMLIRDDGSMIGTVGGGCVEGEVFNAAKQVMQTEKAKMLDFSLGQDVAYENGLICGGQLNIYVEPVVPQPAAFLFGAGHVSKSLAQVASIAGFETTVVDDRAKYASQERFPEAKAVHAGEYEEIFPQLEINGSSYIIIVTRGHRDDMRVLRLAVQSEARFIAMIGSKRKVISIVKELEKEGIPRAAFEKLTAPMGLDIGAVSPEEIAVSVVAEMIAVRRQPESEWQSLSKSIFTNPAPRGHFK